MNTRKTPKKPTVGLTQKYLRKWTKLEKYKVQEESLTLLFKKFCRRSDDILHVLLKVSVLNDFYSTNIFNAHAVATHIVKINVTNRISSGDQSVVNEMAGVKIRGKKRKFYSFASKYCNHHNPESFPIYDSYVEKMLMHFKKRDCFMKFTKAELKQYSRFVEVIQAFRRYYGLHQFSLRQIDIYLWLAGKDAFGKSYGPRKKNMKDKA